MNEIDQVFAEAVRKMPEAPTIIACLYSCDEIPDKCEPMLRSPEPTVGQTLDEGFHQSFAAAMAFNPAVHDGAIMFKRPSRDVPYRVSGWSYRLFPPPVTNRGVPNRGSAFNSCLAMSVVRGIDAVYLITRGVLYRFQGGQCVEISLGSNT
jgi:hypothetical protein